MDFQSRTLHSVLDCLNSQSVNCSLAGLATCFVSWDSCLGGLTGTLSSTTCLITSRKIFQCLAIIDCTEIKTETPSSLKVQSQCYSDYKSSTTLKSLVAVDPMGALIFVSALFSGSISDNEICVQSGFYEYLSRKIAQGHLKAGDVIMADKGFTIDKELGELGLGLNIPPFASSAAQMSVSDVAYTNLIAAHRIHVERRIGRIKKFKLVGHKIPIKLFPIINEIWFVCSFLTNFQDNILKKNI